jgi:hypothetical protein
MSYTAVSHNNPLKTVVMNASIPDARTRFRVLMRLEKPELDANPALKLEAVLVKSLMWTLR